MKQIIAILIIILISILSCEDEGPLKPYWTYYNIHTDSIRVQDEILQTEVLDITFYFALYSDCYQFHSFETNFESNTISVKLRGKEHHNVSCNGAIYFKEKILPVTGFPVGMCYIRVKQPVGEDLVDSVLVLR